MLIISAVIIILSFSVTYLVTPFVIALAMKFSLTDNPKTRLHPAHTHKGIIPRAGGLAIYLGIFVPLFFITDINKIFIGIFLATSLLIIIGLWDDFKDRSPYIRFFTNCLTALLAVGIGIGIPYITNPFGGIIHLDSIRFVINFMGNHSILIISDILAFLWIIWTTNIIGWSGGVDGQLPGFVAISSFVIGLLSLRFATLDAQQIQVVYLAFATTGAFLGFLPWNFFPQKIMPGYGGKTLAGFLLAVLSIMSFSKLGTSLLVLAVPMTDAIFMILKRILSKKSPVWASSGHLHHHLLTLGWSKRKVALFYWLISLVAGIIALTLNSKQKIFAGILILVVLVGFIFWVNFLRKMTVFKEDDL